MFVVMLGEDYGLWRVFSTLEKAKEAAEQKMRVTASIQDNRESLLMTAEIIVCHKWTSIEPKEGVKVIDTTSGGNTWTRNLSPFIIGPCYLYKNYTSHNMENAWQFAKVYEEDTEDNEPTKRYWTWAKKGWLDHKAHRYPKGKGRKPLYSLWDGSKLDYITARKVIYVPLYAEAVQRTEAWSTLKDLIKTFKTIYLRDWDGWDMQKAGITSLTDVVNNPHKKMGHAFVLKMMLEKDKALKQCRMRN